MPTLSNDTHTPLASLALEEISFLGHGLARPECALAHSSGFTFVPDWTEPGGVTAIAPDGAVTRHRVQRKTPAAQAVLTGTLRGNGIALLPGGDFLIAHLGDETGGVFRLSVDGTLDAVVTHLEGEPLPPTNFVTLDDAHRLWITVSTRQVPRAAAYRADVADGFIIRARSDGALPTLAADNLGYTNECMVHPDGEHLYVNETFARRLSRFKIAADGSLDARETVANFGPGTFPDGLAFDAAGDVWITSIVSNRVLRVRHGPVPKGQMRQGRVETYLEDVTEEHLAFVEQAYDAHAMGRPHLDKAAGQRCRNVSNLAFCGADLDRAVLGCLLDTRLPVIPMPVRGQAPVHWTFDIEPLKTALQAIEPLRAPS
ncbi:MAG: SMP-30/gluconolactonase/LRE family protein [Pseudomonadota bacterium]